MAEKKVLTDPNLLKIILSFAGVEIKKECEICGQILKYQILNQEVIYEWESYINLETCEKKYFCDEDCLYFYKRRYRNEKFCIFLCLIMIIIVLLMCLLVFLI